MSMPQDLSVQAFLVLRSLFFDSATSPRPFPLRAKQNTQDDPLDEHIAKALGKELPGVTCIKAQPLTTPDLVLMRPELCNGMSQQVLSSAPDRIIGIEVKKLRNTGSGIARATGLDYNSTPPCGTVRVYDRGRRPLDIQGYYLFVEEIVDISAPAQEQVRIASLVLCDGDILNDEFEFYLQVIQPRAKQTGLGSYGDGAIRPRPMVIFPNPLSYEPLIHYATLIHADPDLEKKGLPLQRIMTIRRKGITDHNREFYAYRATIDVPPNWQEIEVLDPFATVKKPTQGKRGRLELNISIITQLPLEQPEDAEIVPGESIK